MTNSAPRFLWVLEPAIYALIATSLICQIFFVNGVITLPKAGMVLVGEVFGLMAAYMLAPVTTMLEKKADGQDIVVHGMAEIFTIKRHQKSDTKKPDNQKDAAWKAATLYQSGMGQSGPYRLYSLLLVDHPM